MWSDLTFNSSSAPRSTCLMSLTWCWRFQAAQTYASTRWSSTGVSSTGSISPGPIDNPLRLFFWRTASPSRRARSWMRCIAWSANSSRPTKVFCLTSNLILLFLLLVFWLFHLLMAQNCLENFLKLSCQQVLIGWDLIMVSWHVKQTTILG